MRLPTLVPGPMLKMSAFCKNNEEFYWNFKDVFFFCEKEQDV